MSQVHIFAIFDPAPGKVERLRSLLIDQCSEVHQKEDYALRFIVTEQFDSEVPQFYLFETYPSKEATDKHTAEPHFQQMFKLFQEEDLLAKAPQIGKTRTIAGFDLDRKIMAPTGAAL